MLELIDSHTHLDDSRLDDCLDKIIQQATRLGVEQFIIPARHPKYFDKQHAIQQQFEGLHCAYGIHPWFIEQPKAEIAALEAWLNKGLSCAAIGEIGLDFYPNMPDKQTQIDVFEAQLHLAQERRLPVIIHAVKSLDTALSMLKKTPVPFVIHSFNSSPQQATNVLEQGGFIGLSGQILRASDKLMTAIKQTPLERILIETDSPDQNVFDDKPINKPGNLVYVAEKLAEIKDISMETVARQTTANSKQFFNI